MTTDNQSSSEIPECLYPNPPILICPDRPTPNHTLYLSNLDNQENFRYFAEIFFLFEKAAIVESLKLSLSRVLSEYYPLAGRLRSVSPEDEYCRFEVDCNGKGALFAEAFLDYSCQQFLEFSGTKPNKSWEKLIYKVKGLRFVDVPPLVVQVTYLKCGGMILCISINHCLCDGMGTSQFLNAWAHITTNPTSDLPVTPFHSREILKPRNPPKVNFSHPLFVNPTPKLGQNNLFNIHKYLRSQPLVTLSITFNSSEIHRLKQQIMVSSLKCTNFEALATHTWRAWVQSLNLSDHLQTVKLVFSINIRKRLNPEIPKGYYGNGIVLACAEAKVKDLVSNNLCHGVKAIQHANSCINDDYIRSMIDLLEDKMVNADVSTTLVMSQGARSWGSNLNFGTGDPLHCGPLSISTDCLLIPMTKDSIRMLISLPQVVAEKFEFYMTKFFKGKAKI